MRRRIRQRLRCRSPRQNPNPCRYHSLNLCRRQNLSQHLFCHPSLLPNHRRFQYQCPNRFPCQNLSLFLHQNPNWYRSHLPNPFQRPSRSCVLRPGHRPWPWPVLIIKAFSSFHFCLCRKTTGVFGSVLPCSCGEVLLKAESGRTEGY